jgi:hypothetical protein
MSITSVSHIALPSFLEFVNDSSPGDLEKVWPGTPACLADFIEAWARSGHGIYACNGNHGTFLGIVIAIIEGWLDQPDLLDYVPDEGSGEQGVERRVSSIFGERGTDHRILDPDFFTMWKFRWLHGREPKQ